MLKKLLFFTILSSYLIANNGQSPIQNSSLKESIKTAKTYKNLINALKVSPKGEHAVQLAIIYLNGIEIPDESGSIVKKDTQKAIKFFSKAIDLGYYNAAQILGSLFYYHEDLIPLDKDHKFAKKFLKIAKDNGLHKGSVILSKIYNEEGNNKKAVKILEEGALHNDAASQLALAILYKTGFQSPDYNVTKNELIANTLLQKACLNEDKTEFVKNFCSSDFIEKQK